MKRKLAVFGLVLALFAGVVTEEKARANTSVGFNLFYSDLAPYGNWMQYQDYGYAWSPGQVGAGWQPYTDGQWVWSDQGWTWASYEPWGWATYHYGRWVFDPAYGWLWLPGSTWAPAWVSWYQSPGYVGWSPLPPDNNFFIEIGLSFVNYGGGYYDYGYNDYGYYGYNDYDYYDYGHRHKNKHRHHKKGKYYDNDYYAPGEHCVFVPEDKFGRGNAKLSAIETKERDLIARRNVKNVTNIKVDNDKIYNYGPDKGAIERATNSKIRQVSLADSDLVALRSGKQNQKLNDNVYSVYRPKIERKQGENPFTASPLGRDAAKSPSMTRNNLNNPNNPDGGEMRPQGLKPNTGQRDTLVQDRGKPVDPRGPYGNSGPEEYGVIRNDNGMKRQNFSGTSNDVRPLNNNNGSVRQDRNLRPVERGPEPDAVRRSAPVEARNSDPRQSFQQRNPYYPGGTGRSRNNRAVQMPRAPQERPSMNRPPDTYRPRNNRNNVSAPEIRQAPSPVRGNMNAVSRPRPERSQDNRARSVNNNYRQPQPQAEYRPEKSTRSNNSDGRQNRSRNASSNRDSAPRQSIRSDSPSMRSSSPGNVRSFNNGSSLRSRSR